ncbi:MAG TPA: sigma-70 family RNA polymerase sigma factor [Planctomycetota bacterium]|nr:sigma-70 family RNA polymerase sigma factor [Planctomycetota bacterium]
MNRDSAPDSALLDRYVAGDRRGAAILFIRYRQPLLAYLRRRLGSPDLAEEALQETFCRLLEGAKRLARHPRLEAWLYAVAHNVAVDVKRRRRRRAASFSDIWEDGSESKLLDPAASGPEAVLKSRELSRTLLEAIRALSAPERKVFLLRTESALPFREIAARLGAPLNTVLSRMHRAMNKVRVAMVRGGWAAPRRKGLR